MHELDSVMRSVELYDEVILTIRDGSGGNVFFDCEVGKDNTVTKALALSAPLLSGKRVDVSVKKRIPIGAGLGGSSADAAAVIYALNSVIGYENFGLNANDIALKVGSDVPFMLRGGATRVVGIGGNMCEFVDKTEYFGVAKGVGFVSSGGAYKKFDELYNGAFTPSDNDKLVDGLKRGDFAAASSEFFNALTKPAAILNPNVERTINELKEFSPIVNLTGSGSYVVAYFDSRESAERAAHKTKGVFLAPSDCGVEVI